MSILRIRDASGRFVAIPSIRGERGEKGDKGDAGSVTAVNGLLPDGSGNVKLGAVHPYNLLDNSDFRNPVNQRGQDSYTNGGYCIDRWRTSMASGITTYVKTGILWLGKGYGQFIQELASHHNGQALTFAIYLATASADTIIAIINDGVTQVATPVHQGLNIVTHTVSSDAATLFVGLQNNDQNSDQSCTPVWAALYEGTYTAGTLPPYVPKGCAVELAECQRYYTCGTYCLARPFLAQDGMRSYLCDVRYPARMRIVQPTVSFTNVKRWSDQADLSISLAKNIGDACGFNSVTLSEFVDNAIIQFDYAASADL